MNIYVSNLPYAATDDSLREAFTAFGEVVSARIIRDRVTSRSRGFGFVEMAKAEDGQKSLEGLNGIEIQGRRINAREARPREEGTTPKGQGNGERPQGERQPGGRPREVVPLNVIKRGVY